MAKKATKKKATKKKAGGKSGQPLLWPVSRLTALQEKIDSYFLTHGGKGENDAPQPPMTASGLCLAMDFNHRQSLLENAQRSDVIGDAIKKAILRVAEWIEGKSFGNNPTGAIFWLKNHGWIDERSKNAPINLKIDGVRITIDNSTEKGNE